MGWTKEEVEQEIAKIVSQYDDYSGAPGLEAMAIKLRDLAIKIQADMSAENAVLRNRVDTLERALSVSDQHVADIVLANS